VVPPRRERGFGFSLTLQILSNMFPRALPAGEGRGVLGIRWLEKRRRTVSKSDGDVVIVSGVRTPIGKFGGALKDLRAHRLAGIVIG